jgi:hypothetical protein
VNCGCPECRLNVAAFEAIERGDIPDSLEVRAEMVSIWEGRAENERGGAATSLKFASQDDGYGFYERAAMFRGLAFRRREIAAEHQAQADRLKKSRQLRRFLLDKLVQPG